MDKVTIVVPCYNVEKYVDKCITSIIEQDYANLEVLVYNDGSTDNTLKKLEKYRSIGNITVFNHKNCGLGTTRNKGINAAKGKYICFVDSDDWIAPNFITELVSVIGDSTIAYCDRYFYRDGDLIEIKYPLVNSLQDRPDLLGKLSFNATNKIFRLDSLKSVGGFCPTIFEDIVPVTRLMFSENMIRSVDKPLYYVRQNREGSITATLNPNEYILLQYLIDISKDIRDKDVKLRFYWWIYSVKSTLYFNKKLVRFGVNPLKYLFLSIRTILAVR